MGDPTVAEHTQSHPRAQAGALRGRDLGVEGAVARELEQLLDRAIQRLCQAQRDDRSRHGAACFDGADGLPRDPDLLREPPLRPSLFLATSTDGVVQRIVHGTSVKFGFRRCKV